jgi:hypothetical protein
VLLLLLTVVLMMTDMRMIGKLATCNEHYYFESYSEIGQS